MMKHLMLWQKLGLLCLGFVVPTVFLACLLVQYTAKDVDFALKEEDGAAYFVGLAAEFNGLVDRSLGVAAPGLPAAAEEARALGARLDADMRSAEASTKASEAVKAALSSGSPADFDAALDAVSDQMGKVEDGSNLTLDPDLDSYYTQDLATLKLPALSLALARSVAPAAKMLADGGQRPSNEDVVAFLTAKGGLAAALSAADGDVASAERGNPDGTVAGSLSGYPTLDAKVAAYAKLLDDVNASRPVAAADLRAAEHEAQKALRGVWAAANGEVAHLLERRVEGFRSGMWRSLLLSAAVLAAAAAFAALVARSITGPVAEMVKVVRRLGGGEVGEPVRGADLRNEFGPLAAALESWRASLVAAEAGRREEAAAAALRERRAARLEAITGGFSDEAAAVVSAVSGTVGTLSEAARVMSDNVARTNDKAIAVAAAAEQAAQSSQAVATAAEQLSAAIREIGTQAETSSSVSAEATRLAASANDIVSGLSDASTKIGDVVKLIHGIARQTNLLALNATIEAARAGEAGKGFSVVANEVKHLANQTAKATDDITAQIGTVQSASERAVEAIAAVVRQISDLGGVASSIAAAVEEQSAATAEIVRSIQQTASGAEDVSANIGGVSAASSEMGGLSREVLDASRALSRNTGSLDELVKRFIGDVQAI
jgi:methyl-accepting chemotaxis protein